MTSLLRLASALVLSVGLTYGPASAHPHMFVDALSRLLTDDEGRLTAVRTALVVDPLTTMFTLEEYEIGPDNALTPDQQTAIADGIIAGLGAYEFFTEMKVDGERISLGAPAVLEVGLSDGMLSATLELQLEIPLAPQGHDFEIALFDPTYYASVVTIGPILLPASMGECEVSFQTFKPEMLDTITLSRLGQLTREETPDDQRIGARFADRNHIECPK